MANDLNLDELERLHGAALGDPQERAAFWERVGNAFPALLALARRAAKAAGEAAVERGVANVMDMARNAAESDRDTLRAELDRVTKERDELKALLSRARHYVTLGVAASEPGSWYGKNFRAADNELSAKEPT